MQLPGFLKNNTPETRTLLRWFIILAVLAASAIAFRLAQTIPVLIWVGGVGALVLGLLALKNMTAALTLVLLTSATTGLTLGTGRADPIPGGLLMIAGLVLVWYFKMMILDRKFYLKPSPINLPVIAFLLATLVSWIVGYGIWELMIKIDKNIFIVQAGQYAIFALSFAAMFLAYQQDLKEKDLKRWNWIVIAIGMAGMLFEIFTHTLWTRSRLGITGTLIVLPVILATAQLVFNPDLKIGMKVVSVAILLVWGYWAFNNLVWKGGWIPTLVGLVILALFRSWKVFILGILIFGIIVLVNWEGLEKTLLVPEVNSTSTIRPIIWLDILRMVVPRSPILGLGLVNYMYYWYDPSFVAQSRIAAGANFMNTFVFSIPSHNMFVDIFAQTGLVGISFFLWLVIAALRVLYRNSQRLKPGFLRAFSIGVFAGFLAMLFNSFLFADWLIPFVYNINITGFRQSVYTWILIGGAMTISANSGEAPERAAS